MERGKRVSFNVDKCRIDLWQPDLNSPVFNISIKGHFQAFLDPIEIKWIPNTIHRVKQRIWSYNRPWFAYNTIVLMDIPRGQAFKLNHKHNFNIEIVVKANNKVNIKKDTDLKFVIKELCIGIIREDILNNEIELC